MMARGTSSGAGLPETVPIFPLSGVLLLPRTLLPLHIFEPRYRAMTRDAIEGERTIAMIQPSGEPGDDPENPPVYRTGCVGRIAKAQETEDGRYLLTLTGISRFHVVSELPLRHGYRRAVADYAGYGADLVEDQTTVIDRDRLLTALEAYLKLKGLSADWETIEGARDEPLVNALAMICPFAPSEKQALLECPDLTERSRLITALFQMAGFPANDDSAGGTVRH